MVVSPAGVGVMIDDRTRYDEYWAMDARIGESSSDDEQTADQITMSCGIGKMLDIGCGEGALVASLLRRGVDAQGLDVSGVVLLRCNQWIPDRFTQGTVLALPFPDNSFQVVVAKDCLQHLPPEDVPQALKEIHRITRSSVFLKIATTHDRDGRWHLTVEGRAWWEKKCFEAGFRKHPAYYRVNDYESLNRDGWQITILLEKIPVNTFLQFPLSALEAERGLHMDMTRDSGERSDAHIIRYEWACRYIKPGDRVLDAACGLGYGSHLIRHSTRATKITGIDGSDYAIDYAERNFHCAQERVEYRVGMLPGTLAAYPDGSFDTILSFETLEHVEDPVTLLSEFYRLLTPGGRVIVSVPNDWSDESGEDPNPFHLHVYDWAKLKLQLSANFILEDAWAQTASQCKASGRGNRWEPRQRSLHPVVWEEHPPEDCEWWLMTAMKSPLEPDAPYRERVFSNISLAEHSSIRYARYFVNPWLMHAMVNSGYRIKNQNALQVLANIVTATFPETSNDYKAALCVRAYKALQTQELEQKKSIIDDIDRVNAACISDQMALRWKVSLLFVKARLLESFGALINAKETFFECSCIDVREFGIHLSTKTTEAAYLSGKIAYSLGQPSEARRIWQNGVKIGHTLLKIDLVDVLINPDFPNLFNHGDGVREYAVAWDNIARCANGLHLLGLAAPIDYSALDNCHQTEYLGVTADLITTRKVLVARTEELVQTRQTLVERTELLLRAKSELSERCRTSAERTKKLARAKGLLRQLTVGTKGWLSVLYRRVFF